MPAAASTVAFSSMKESSFSTLSARSASFTAACAFSRPSALRSWTSWITVSTSLPFLPPMPNPPVVVLDPNLSLQT